MSKKLIIDDKSESLTPGSQTQLDVLRAEMDQLKSALADHPRNVRIHTENRQKSVCQGSVMDKKFEERPQVSALLYDLQVFIERGGNPSHTLDSALKKDSSLYTQIALFSRKQSYSDLHWPLARVCAFQRHPVRMLDYLFAHGAGKIEAEVSILLEITARNNPFLFEHLWNAGYKTLIDKDLLSIYHASGPSVLFREAFDHRVFQNNSSKLLEKTKYTVYHAAKEGNLSILQYSHQKGFPINYPPGESFCFLDNIMYRRPSLDILKYLFAHYKKDIKAIDLELEQGLSYAACSDQLQIVHYLVNSHIYTERIILQVQRAGMDSAKEYLSYYNPKTGLDPSKTQRLKELEKRELEKLVQNWKQILLRYLTEPKYLLQLNLNKFIYLALTSKKDAKITGLEEDSIMPRLTLINHLLPLDSFAATYVWSQLLYFINTQVGKAGLFLDKYPFSLEDLMLFVATAYKLYINKTEHIIEMHARDTFNEALRDREEGPDSGISPESSLSTLRAIVAGLVLQQLLPTDLSSIVRKYVAFQSTLVTSSLTHLWQAVHSKTRCLNCNFKFTNKNILFFSDKNQKIAVSSTTEMKPTDIVAPALAETQGLQQAL